MRGLLVLKKKKERDFAERYIQYKYVGMLTRSKGQYSQLNIFIKSVLK